MSTMVLPSAWVKHRIGADSVTWTRANHTHDQPNLFIFKASNAGAGTSKYQVKGVLGVDGSVMEAGQATTNTIIELNVRQVEGQNDVDVKNAINELGDLITTTTFQDDVIDLQIPLDGNQV